MGRKALAKQRVKNKDKMRSWVSGLIVKMQDYDLSVITIDDLAGLMKKSKSTVYEYFESKSEIVELAAEVHLDQLKPYKSIITDLERSPIDRYKEFLILMCRGVKKIKPGFLPQLKQHYPSAWVKVSGTLMGIIADQRLFYESGMKEGYFKKVSTSLLSQLDYHFVFNIMIEEASYSEETMEEMVSDYLTIKFEGLVS